VLQGQQVGKLNIFCADTLVQETPLYAAATIEDGDLFRKSTDAVKHLLLGWLP
jgi:D-alanyl-D-alanine carboxypeptidase (penicillin-binding protein 5/6)